MAVQLARAWPACSRMLIQASSSFFKRPVQTRSFQVSSWAFSSAATKKTLEVTNENIGRLEEHKRHKLVIFDKNGTLINFHEIWTPWVNSLVGRIENTTGWNLEDKICKALDICKFTKKVRGGVFAEGTTSQIKHALVELLQTEGLSNEESKRVVEICWKDCDTSDPETLSQISDLRSMFDTIKASGMKIAVMTSGNRGITEKTMKQLGLHNDIDYTVCGDDPVENDVEKSKVAWLCETLGVKPEETVIVGDTVGDVKMGKDACVSRTIGVLSGIGTRLDLSRYSDIIVDNVRDALPCILNGDTSNADGYVSDDETNSRTKTKASLVIFDKDGTLICFNSMWTPWAMDLVNRLEKLTGLDLSETILRELGYCNTTQRWKPGLLAEGTTDQNKNHVRKLLQREGMSEEKALETVNKVWQHSDHSGSNINLQTLDNLGNLFKDLHEHGIKIAVCTADSRQATEQFLHSQHEAGRYVDMLVCGDDADAEPKPSAYNALKICQSLGVPPHEAVVVGDTIADMGMGRRAKLGATVAVLSGVGQVSDLDSHADVMLISIKDLLPIVATV